MNNAGKIIGKVFDIRRFSTHDGDGIRTTIFLKGCPLQCRWCQNPEGISPEPQLVYFENRCIHCGTCTKVCSNNSIILKDKKLYIDKSATTRWEEPIDSCPTACLTMDCKSYSVEELVELALKDEAFFKHGGGVTLSGGEPLFQKDFTLALLIGLKERGINTAIETSLAVDQKVVKAVLPYLDRIYADMKVFDSNLHKDFTGVDNELIKENIKFILESQWRDKVIIRTPLIPTFTATLENIHAIVKFITGIYPEVQYELLNYNPLAKAKYNLVEQKYCFEDNERMYTDSEMNYFRVAARAVGAKNLIIEV